MHTPYFFSQRRERRFQRRLRKTLDDVSVFGEKRDTFQALRADGELESVVSAGGPAKSALRRGSAASGKRVSLSGKVVLPPVDRDGPRLVSGEQASDSKSISGESRRNPLPDEKEALSSWAKVKEVYKFHELKFGSTSILSNLAKCLDSDTVRENATTVLHDRLDAELLRKFLQNHQSLTSDTVVEKREWQTDCYLDLSIKNKQPFLTEVEGDRVKSISGGEERRKSDQVIAAISKRYAQRFKPKPSTIPESIRKKGKEKSPPKRVTLNQEVMSRMESPKRPQTAHSVLSNFSFHSDYSRPSSAGESRINDSHYDVLPPELRPSIMLYRRESVVPKMKVKGPKTRLEKFRDLTSHDHHHPSHRKIKKLKKPEHEKEEATPKTTIGRRPMTARPPAAGLSRTLSGPHQAVPPIPFSLMNQDVYDKGWVVHAAETQDPEMATLRIWDRKSKERLRQRQEEKMIAKQKHADGPLVVKFYSNPQTRCLRSKHQRSATFPLPTVLNKLPPSVANFTTPGVATNDVMMIGEGPDLAVLIHPDGSGHANYHGRYRLRQAVCQSRTDQDSKALCTVAYDDTDFHPVLACFTPLGKGWCYYSCSGALHMFYDTKELRMYSEDGHVTRRIVWLSDKAPVSIQLNPCLSFHCTSLSNMVLRFSCRGQTYKFNVSPPATLNDNQPPGRIEDSGRAALQSGLEFVSDAAAVCSKAPSPPPPPSPVHKLTEKQKKALKRTSTKEEDGMRGVEEEEAKLSAMNLNALEKNLALYRDRITSTVDEWMSHYRQSIGISLPAHLRTSTSRSPSPAQTRTTEPTTRQLHSSRSYAGEVGYSRPASQLAHFYTHPLPSRVTTPFGGQRSPCYSPPDAEGEYRTNVCMTTPPSATPLRTTPTPAKILDYSDGVLVCEGQSQSPWPEGRKIRRRSSSVPTKKYGCPVALHNLLLGNHHSMSPCKCDKRRPPYIGDLEYDIFLKTHVPNSQVVVVCVLSSVMEGSCQCEPMIDALHYSMNRQRFSPCTQSSSDMFRVLKYDLGHALSGTKRDKPLLIERHAAWPGLFLMYVGGHLVCADCVFNGYGTTRRDFLKQVDRCLQESSKGRYLPSDYRFTAHTGGKHPDRTAWAYPLTGVLGFLVPYSPSYPSSSLGGEEDEDRDPAPAQLDRNGVLHSGMDLSHSDAALSLLS